MYILHLYNSRLSYATVQARESRSLYITSTCFIIHLGFTKNIGILWLDGYLITPAAQISSPQILLYLTDLLLFLWNCGKLHGFYSQKVYFHCLLFFAVLTQVTGLEGHWKVHQYLDYGLHRWVSMQFINYLCFSWYLFPRISTTTAGSSPGFIK